MSDQSEYPARAVKCGENAPDTYPRVRSHHQRSSVPGSRVRGVEEPACAPVDQDLVTVFGAELRPPLLVDPAGALVDLQRRSLALVWPRHVETHVQPGRPESIVDVVIAAISRYESPSHRRVVVLAQPQVDPSGVHHFVVPHGHAHVVACSGRYWTQGGSGGAELPDAAAPACAGDDASSMPSIAVTVTTTWPSVAWHVLRSRRRSPRLRWRRRSDRLRRLSAYTPSASTSSVSVLPAVSAD